MTKRSNPSVLCVLSDFSKWLVSTWHGTKATEDSLHQTPNTRARKRIPLQPLSDEKAEDRDCPHVSPIREADQNLVPKPTHEVEEGQQAAQHEECEAEKRATSEERQ